MKIHRLGVIICLLLWIGMAFSQSGSNHPELDWFTIRTLHFEVHYHEGAERTARVVAKIAKDIYEPVTSLYDWKPDGIIHFIIRDHDDNSNGAAFYYDNKVEIWAPQMTFILRGTHNWLRNVVTHEFSHMISLGASRKMTRKVPAFYLQMIGYEAEKRPDVLYGYPNVIASYPVPMTVMPMWLAEGMAQYMAPGLDYDRWDTHRDMLIRTAVVADRLHRFEEMGVFGKNSLGNERTYNAGYALTRYIAQNWGAESLVKLGQELKKPFTFSIDGALQRVTGLAGPELYAQWRRHLVDHYNSRLETIRSNQVTGKIVTPKGIGNIYPAWSPDGTKIAFCGSESSDYLTLTNLNIHDVTTGKTKSIRGGVNGTLHWSKDGEKLLYARQRKNKHGSEFYDLHVYDLARKKEHRLTRDLRAWDPAWSPDQSQIVCVVQRDGTDNLLLLSSEGREIRKLTEFFHGEGLYHPSWSPDGKTIVYSQARKHGRDIKMMELATGKVTVLLSEAGDARDPVFSVDGQHVYFAWDQTGIFNIYRLALNSESPELLTNVIGGAFMPAVAANGVLAYANFDYDGYKIHLLENPQPISVERADYLKRQDQALELMNTEPSDLAPAVLKAKNFDDTLLQPVESKPYGMTYGQVTFLPRVMLDSNRVKLGTYFYASDILDRYSILGGAAANARKDVDLFAILEYRRLAPTLFVELYGITRNTRQSIRVIDDYPEETPVDIRFSMLEADFGAYYRFGHGQTVRAAYVHARYTSKIKDFYFAPQRITFTSPQNTYFIGNHFTLQWNLDAVVPRADSDINPSAGRKVQIKLSHELNRFFDNFATDNDYGTLQEVYTPFNYNRLELDWKEYFSVPFFKKHSLTTQFVGGYIDRPVDDFFNFFAGGMPGLRGYPFYSIEGRKLLLGRLTYRFPLLHHSQRRLANITSNRLYLGAFFDYGNAFNEDKLDFAKFKKDVGLSLRFSAFSFYGFPTAFAIDAAYGLNRVVNQETQYGKEWRYYVTLIFDFLD